MMVHEVRCFAIRLVEQFVLIFKAVLLAGRVTMLFEQASQLELPPDGGKALDPLRAERPYTSRVKRKIRDVDKMRDHAEKTLNSQRNTLAAQDQVWNLREITLALAGQNDTAVTGYKVCIGNKSVRRSRRRLLHQLITMNKRTGRCARSIMFEITGGKQLTPCLVHGVVSAADLCQLALSQCPVRHTDIAGNNEIKPLCRQRQGFISQYAVVADGKAGVGH